MSGSFLVMGSNAWEETAASLYSLIETAKLTARGPEAYLHEVLLGITDHPVNRIDELLPWAMAAQTAVRKAA